MKRRPYFKKSVSTTILLLLSLLSLHAQQIININAPASTRENDPISTEVLSQLGEEVLNFRYFDFNPALRDVNSYHVGDTLILDFFENQKFKAIINHILSKENGTVSVRATVQDEHFATCIMIISESNVSISVQFPTRNQAFFVAKKDNRLQLSHCDLTILNQRNLIETSAPVPAEAIEESIDLMRNIENGSRDSDEEVVIDILVVYTAAAAQWALNDHYVSDINDLIDIAMALSNQTLENSQTNITFNLVYSYQDDYMETNTTEDLYLLQEEGDGYLDDVHTYRRQYKADVVVFIPEVNFTGGVAFLLDSEFGAPYFAFALSRVQQTATSFTLVHEVAHNMSCGHHKQQNFQPGPGGIYSYSAGWRGITEQGNPYSTVMTYEDGSYFPDGIYSPRIPYFSSPLLSYEGVVIGDAAHGDNAKTLRQVKNTISQYSEVLYNASLSAITSSVGTLSPGFHPDITHYTITIPSTVEYLVINAVTLYSNASAYGLGIQYPETGENLYTIRVVAGDGVVEKFYYVNVIKLATIYANDSTLMNLSVSNGILTPAFQPTILNYSVEVPYDVSEITVTAVSTNPSATVSGAGLHPLNVGTNTIPIEVTAANGIARQTYSVFVTRLANHDATLQDLSVSSGTLTPDFHPDIMTYHVTVPFTTEQITVTGTTNDATAAVIGNGEYSLALGNNPISLQVTAANGVTTKNYLIHVERLGSDNADLQEITVSQGVLTPAFSPDILQYEVYLIGSLHYVTLSSTAYDPNAVIDGNGLYGITTGNNEKILTVTAQDGITTKQYTVNFICTPNSDATLTAIQLSDGVLSPVFSPNLLEYSVEVNNEIEEITVLAVPADTNATVIGNGFYPLGVDNTIVSLEVIAEDNVHRSLYEIVITRLLSQDASLRSLTVLGYSLYPDFDPAIFQYRTYIPEDVTSIYVGGLTNHIEASIEGGGIINLDAGENRVILTVTAQDGSTTQDYEIVIDRTSGIGNLSEDNCRIYPNPTSDKVMIESKDVIHHIRLYDLYGKLLQEKHLHHYQYELDIDSYAKGVYILFINETITKIIKN